MSSCDDLIPCQATVGSVVNCPPIAPINYEYLDHTADVQLHAWGLDFATALQQLGMSMFGYMTEIDSVCLEYTYDICATGDDQQGLVFHFLDEWLFAFSAEPFFIPRVIKVLSLEKEDNGEWKVNARGWGESFRIGKHPQGTEVKAITYSNMQVHHKDNPPGDQLDHTCDIFVIIDI